MDKTAFRANKGGNTGQKGDHVMLGFAFDTVDFLNIEIGFLTDGIGGLLRDHAQSGLGIAGVDFNIQPDSETAFIRPDRGHLRAGVACYH